MKETESRTEFEIGLFDKVLDIARNSAGKVIMGVMLTAVAAGMVNDYRDMSKAHAHTAVAQQSVNEQAEKSFLEILPDNTLQDNISYEASALMEAMREHGIEFQTKEEAVVSALKMAAYQVMAQKVSEFKDVHPDVEKAYDIFQGKAEASPKFEKLIPNVEEAYDGYLEKLKASPDFDARKIAEADQQFGFNFSEARKVKDILEKYDNPSTYFMITLTKVVNSIGEVMPDSVRNSDIMKESKEYYNDSMYDLSHKGDDTDLLVHAYERGKIMKTANHDHEATEMNDTSDASNKASIPESSTVVEQGVFSTLTNKLKQGVSGALLASAMTASMVGATHAADLEKQPVVTPSHIESQVSVFEKMNAFNAHGGNTLFSSNISSDNIQKRETGFTAFYDVDRKTLMGTQTDSKDKILLESNNMPMYVESVILSHANHKARDENRSISVEDIKEAVRELLPGELGRGVASQMNYTPEQISTMVDNAKYTWVMQKEAANIPYDDSFYSATYEEPMKAALSDIHNVRSHYLEKMGGFENTIGGKIVEHIAQKHGVSGDTMVKYYQDFVNLHEQGHSVYERNASQYNYTDKVADEGFADAYAMPATIAKYEMAMPELKDTGFRQAAAELISIARYVPLKRTEMKGAPITDEHLGCLMTDNYYMANPEALDDLVSIAKSGDLSTYEERVKQHLEASAGMEHVKALQGSGIVAGLDSKARTNLMMTEIMMEPILRSMYAESVEQQKAVQVGNEAALKEGYQIHQGDGQSVMSYARRLGEMQGANAFLVVDNEDIKIKNEHGQTLMQGEDAVKHIAEQGVHASEIEQHMETVSKFNNLDKDQKALEDEAKVVSVVRVHSVERDGIGVTPVSEEANYEGYNF